MVNYYSIGAGIIVVLVLVYWLNNKKNLNKSKKLVENEKKYNAEQLSKKNEHKPIKNEKELRKILLVLDELLTKLPENEVDKFAKSKEFESYKEIMSELVDPDYNESGIKSNEKKNVYEILKLLEKNIISGNEARKMLGLPEKMEEPEIIVREIIKKIPVIKKEKITEENNEEEVSDNGPSDDEIDSILPDSMKSHKKSGRVKKSKINRKNFNKSDSKKDLLRKIKKSIIVGDKSG